MTRLKGVCPKPNCGGDNFQIVNNNLFHEGTVCLKCSIWYDVDELDLVEEKEFEGSRSYISSTTDREKSTSTRGVTETKTYVKKPIKVQARQLDRVTKVHTLEGKMFGCDGDYLVTGPYDEQYIVKQHIFEQTYEEVKDNG